MVLEGFFDRFDGLRCGVIEMGASWAPSLMARLDHAAKSFSRTEPLLAKLSLKPSDYIRRQVRFTPLPGEDIAEMVAISEPELYLFSSDYPHPEGTKDPIGRFERSFDEHGTDETARQLSSTRTTTAPSSASEPSRGSGGSGGRDGGRSAAGPPSDAGR